MVVGGVLELCDVIFQGVSLFWRSVTKGEGSELCDVIFQGVLLFVMMFDEGRGIHKETRSQ